MPRTLTRRSFLAGACGAAMSLAGSRLTSLAVSIPHDSTAYSQERLVVVFLRGGWDALNVVPPIGGADRGYYQQERPNLQIPTSGTGAALNLNGQFGLHPAMAPLHALYQAGKLAIIHAAGLTSDTRSHFDAMQFMELGTPGVKTTTTGWLTRHLQSAPNLPPTIVLPALSSGGITGDVAAGHDRCGVHERSLGLPVVRPLAIRGTAARRLARSVQRRDLAGRRGHRDARHGGPDREHQPRDLHAGKRRGVPRRVAGQSTCRPSPN